MADYYGVQKKENQFSFQIYQLDIAKANQHAALINFNQLLKERFNNESEQMKQSGNLILDNINLPWQILYQMGATTPEGYSISSIENIDFRQLHFNFDLLKN